MATHVFVSICDLNTLNTDIRESSTHIIENIWIFTARKRSCAKVMFLHLSVILSNGGVSRPRPRRGVCLGGCPGPSPGPGEGVCPGGGCPGPDPGGGVSQHALRQTPPSRQLLLQTVRILLECILVIFVSSICKVNDF